MKKINLQYTTIQDPLPDFIFTGLKKYSSGANLYRPQPEVLVGKLAEKYNLPKERIYLTAGADEAIHMFALAFGQKTYVFTPTYIEYIYVKEIGSELIYIPSLKKNDYKIQVAKIPDATLIFLANPNNPCGFTPKERVIRLVANNSQAMVVIDEAYGEFADLSVIERVGKYPNLAVLRSFSKSYSMAGNRIGYIIGNPETIARVKYKTSWCNVSYLSVGAAVAALEHEEYFARTREGISKRRDDFIPILKKKGFTVFPSKINAVLIKFGSEKEVSQFVGHLDKNGFAVAQGGANSNIGLDNSFVRIAIGSGGQMRKLREVIKRF